MKQRALQIFTPREAYLLVTASMVLGLFVTITFQGVLAGMENIAFLERLSILLGELTILVPSFFILRQRGIIWHEVIPLRKISPVTLIMAAVIVGGAIGLVSVFEVIILPYFPVPDFIRQLELEMTQSTFLDNLVLIIAGTVIAPFVEEFVFRGLLQQSLFYRYGSILPAMVIPTVIFSLFHVAYLFYLPALMELIALALLLAWLMVKTGNLLIPVIVHGLFNLSSFFGVFITAMEETTTLTELGTPWIVTSVLLATAGWVYFKNMPVVVHDDVYLIPPLKEEQT